MTCARGRVCVGGACEDDPCRAITCPERELCNAGQCVADPSAPKKPSDEGDLGATAVGCGCTSGGAAGLQLFGLVLALSVFHAARRTRRRR